MTTTSFPAVGDQGLTSAQWATLYGGDDGIVEDYHTGGVEACVLTRSGDTATVGVGKVKVNGYVLAINTPTGLTLPPVTATTDYYICAVYDDLLNVPLDGTTTADPLGPCRLVVTAGAPQSSTSKTYFVLWVVTRTANQALTASTVSDRRTWTAPSRYARFRPAPAGIPRGTLLTVVSATSSRTQQYVMDVNAAGTGLDWKTIGGLTPTTTFPYVGSYGARSSTTAPVYYMDGVYVRMRGDVQKNGGGNMGTKTGAITIGQMPVGFRPKFTERFICKTSGENGQVEVRVESTGEINVSQTPGDITWLNLSPIDFRAEN